MTKLQAAARLTATSNLPCPVCAGVEGCDHTVPERQNAAERLQAAFPNRNKQRPQWMAAYEQELVRLQPHMRGKVDWDTATYFFHQGMDPKEAAQKAAKK